jgi:hypothetical protein
MGDVRNPSFAAAMGGNQTQQMAGWADANVGSCLDVFGGRNGVNGAGQRNTDRCGRSIRSKYDADIEL